MDSFLQLVKRFELDVQSMAVCHDDDVRLHIDSKVEELRHTIILFNQLRNRRTIISKLPSELLGLIFFYVRDISAVECGTGRLSWIRTVSHVCSLWRELSLSMPYLWASISVTSVGSLWLPEMVRRSCSSNLSISANYDGYKFVHNLQSILEEDVLHRLETLVLTNVDSSCLHAIFPALASTEANADNARFKFPRRFSSLRKLAISTRGRLADPFVLCDATLAAPQLQHLELTKCSVQWDAKFFSRLTHLAINNPTTTHPPPSSATLINALAAASETLTSLTLIRSLQSILSSKKLYLENDDSDVPVLTVVDLPSLQNLSVNETSTNVDHILSFINIISTAPNTKIQIAISSAEDVRKKETWQNGFSRIIARVPELLSRSSYGGMNRNYADPTGRWPFNSFGPDKRGITSADINALSLNYSTSWQRSKLEVGLGLSSASSLGATCPSGRNESGAKMNLPLDFNLSFEWVKPRGAVVHDAACDTSALLALQVFEVFDLAGLERMRCQGINMPTSAWRRALCSLDALREIQFLHVPGGENNFFSGSLAVGGGGPKLSQTVEQFSRALHWDDDGDDAQHAFHSTIASHTGQTRSEYHSYQLQRLPVPALQFIVLQPENSWDCWAIVQDALRRRTKMWVPQVKVLVWE